MQQFHNSVDKHHDWKSKCISSERQLEEYKNSSPTDSRHTLLLKEREIEAMTFELSQR